jgi:hypothetical protein
MESCSVGEVQLKLWGRKPRRKATRKRPPAKPAPAVFREAGHWSYAFVPPSEDEWEAFVADDAAFLGKMRAERKKGSDE